MFGDYKYAAQMRAEEAAEEEYGKDFYDLPDHVRDRLYTEGLRGYAEDMMDAADNRRKAEREG